MVIIMNKDYLILRELGNRVAEIAALPVQQEKKKLWTANNDLHPVRPMVYIDQLPWHDSTQLRKWSWAVPIRFSEL